MGRKLSWDRFRGAAILLMVVVNSLSAAEGIPAFLKHAPDTGYTLADLVAPMFLFAMGLTFARSFQKRYTMNKMDAYMASIKRNLAFIGLGALFSGVTVYFSQDADWGVMQALGVAGLMTLAVIRLAPLWRAATGLAILAGYQIAFSLGAEGLVLSHLHGGMLGAISWGAMLILTTAMVELYTHSRRQFLFAIVLLAAGGALSSLVVPISKPRVSASYVLISLSLCGALFYLSDAIERIFHLETRRDFLCDWGENPLVLYLAHYALIGVFMISRQFFPFPAWLSYLATVIVLVLLNGFVRFLKRRDIRISL